MHERTSSSGPAIAVRGLERAFKGGIKAVDGLDLAVEEGEIYGFLGPNGAGKTTTVRILVTLLRPTGGEARVAGHDVVTEADAVRRSIGVALQEAAIDPLMTGTELLRMQGALHGMRGAEARARATELLELLDRDEATVAFESPKRLPATLRAIADADPSRLVAVCRELTKLHEEVVRGPAGEVAERFADGARGEITLVVAATPAAEGDRVAALDAVRRLVEDGARARTASRVVGQLTGVPANELYRALHADG